MWNFLELIGSTTSTQEKQRLYGNFIENEAMESAAERVSNCFVTMTVKSNKLQYVRSFIFNGLIFFLHMLFIRKDNGGMNRDGFAIQIP